MKEKEQNEFSEMEHQLQLYLLGDTKTMDALQLEYAGKIINLKQVLQKAHQPEMKVYQDFGHGFSEETADSLLQQDFLLAPVMLMEIQRHFLLKSISTEEVPTV